MRSLGERRCATAIDAMPLPSLVSTSLAGTAKRPDALVVVGVAPEPRLGPAPRAGSGAGRHPTCVKHVDHCDGWRYALGRHVPSRCVHERFAARRLQILQLREKLMEGAAQPARIAGSRPRRRGPLEGARDRVLDGACGRLYYRVTTVL